MYNHLLLSKRTVHVINLDPAAEEFKYPCSADIRELITVTSVMKKLNMGPNGSLVRCMEYMMEENDWLSNVFSGFENDYVLIDLPGQIELYTHMDVFKTFAFIDLFIYYYYLLLIIIIIYYTVSHLCCETCMTTECVYCTCWIHISLLTYRSFIIIIIIPYYHNHDHHYISPDSSPPHLLLSPV
jgi:hypothetical protein